LGTHQLAAEVQFAADFKALAWRSVAHPIVANHSACRLSLPSIAKQQMVCFQAAHLVPGMALNAWLPAIPSVVALDAIRT
jgi:hypothetical protein